MTSNLKEITRERMNLKSLAVDTRDGKSVIFNSGEGRQLSSETQKEILKGILYVLRRYGFDLYSSEETLNLHVRLEEVEYREYHTKIWADNSVQKDKNSWKGGLEFKKKDGKFSLIEFKPSKENTSFREREVIDSISQYDWDYGWQRKEEEKIRNMIFLQEKLFEKGGFKSVIEYLKFDLDENEFREFTIFEGEATRDSYPWRMRTRFTPYFKGNYQDGKRNLANMNTVKTVFENKENKYSDIPDFVKKSFIGLSGYEKNEARFKTSSEILEWIWNHPGKRVYFSSLINDSFIKRETKFLLNGNYKSWHYAFMYGYWKEREESNFYQGAFEDIYPEFSLSDFKSLVRRAGEYLYISIEEEGKKLLKFKIGRYPDDSSGYVKMILPEETSEEELKNISNLPWDIPQGKEERYKNDPDDLWSMQIGFKRDWAESWNKFWFDLLGLEGYRKLEKLELTIVE